MRAVLPVRPAGRRRRSSRNLSCFLPRCSQYKEEEPPVLLLRDMDLCYRLLERLVPARVPGIAASRVEILQHVIDYILELQTELDASCPAGEREEPLPCDRRQQLQQRTWSRQRPAASSPQISSQKRSDVEESCMMLMATRPATTEEETELSGGRSAQQQKKKSRNQKR